MHVPKAGDLRSSNHLSQKLSLDCGKNVFDAGGDGRSARAYAVTEGDDLVGASVNPERTRIAGGGDLTVGSGECRIGNDGQLVDEVERPRGVLSLEYGKKATDETARHAARRARLVDG